MFRLGQAADGKLISVMSLIMHQVSSEEAKMLLLLLFIILMSMIIHRVSSTKKYKNVIVIAVVILLSLIIFQLLLNRSNLGMYYNTLSVPLDSSKIVPLQKHTINTKYLILEETKNNQ